MVQLRSDARLNRERIIEAAIHAFAEQGPGAEMKEIAEQAGVAVGTIYRHFPSKEALLLALMEGAIDAAAESVRTAEAIDDPIEGLRFLLVRSFAASCRYGWLFEALLSGLLPAGFQQRLQVLRERKDTGRFERLIQRGIDQQRLRPDLDAAVAAVMLEGATLPWNYERLCGRSGPERAAEATLDAFLRGATGEPS